MAKQTEPVNDQNLPEPTDADGKADTPDDAQQAASNDQQSDSASREAARYRRRLRDTETERDQLASQVQQMMRAEVERIAGTVLDKPATLWNLDISLEDLLEAGNVNPDQVIKAARAAVKEHGLAETRRNYVPREGTLPRPAARQSMADVVMGENSSV